MIATAGEQLTEVIQMQVARKPEVAHHARQRPVAETWGQVEHGPRRAGDADPEMDFDVVAREGLRAMDPDALDGGGPTAP